MFTLLLHKDPVELPECLYKEAVYLLLMEPFKSHPVEYKESHIWLSTKRLRPQKIGDCFIYYSTGSAPQLAKVLLLRTQNLMPQQGLCLNLLLSKPTYGAPRAKPIVFCPAPMWGSILSMHFATVDAAALSYNQ